MKTAEKKPAPKKTEKQAAATSDHAAKPGTAKARVPAKAILEKLVGKTVVYVGRNAKFRNKRVTLRAVRATKDAPCGYDVRLALGDSAQYCSVTSVRA